MGFSPGEFRDVDGRLLHWEGKGDGRIILWDEHETQMILCIRGAHAEKAERELSLLVSMAAEGAL